MKGHPAQASSHPAPAQGHRNARGVWHLRGSRKSGGTLRGVGEGRGVGLGLGRAGRAELDWWGGSGVGGCCGSVIARSPRNVVGDCQSSSGLDFDSSEDRMSQQTIKQQARRTAREMASKWHRAREERERRVIILAERVMVGSAERDAAVTETEKCAGEALLGVDPA